MAVKGRSIRRRHRPVVTIAMDGVGLGPLDEEMVHLARTPTLIAEATMACRLCP